MITETQKQINKIEARIKALVARGTKQTEEYNQLLEKESSGLTSQEHIDNAKALLKNAKAQAKDEAKINELHRIKSHLVNIAIGAKEEVEGV